MLTSPFTSIAENIPGAEGPIYDHDGRWFVVSSDGPILELLDSGQTREHAKTDGVPAGLQVDADNHLWLIDAQLGVMKIDPQGQVTPAVTQQYGMQLVGCNDGALDDAGHLYFTGPNGSGVESPHGRVCCLLTDGTLRTVAEGFAFCNGLSVSPNNRVLVVAETWTKRLIAFDITEPGRLTNRRVFAELPGDDECGPDGIDFDASGHLISTNYGNAELDVLDPSGQLVDRVKLPFDDVSNLHFGGSDGRDLVVTEHATPGVWKARWSVPGVRMSRACQIG